jgi:hypothetical protein
MTKKALTIVVAALCAAASAFAAGSREGAAAGGTALRARTGGWEDIDGLSSASILRVDRSKFGYIDKNGMDGYRMKIVDVSDPAKTVREGLVGGTGRNVAMWAAGSDGRIILVEADELGRQDYTGYNIVVYDQDLRLIQSFPYGNQVGLVEAHRARPLNHREPIIALTDTYAIAGWQDKSPVDADPAPNDKNGVLVIKNPPTDGSDITAAHLSSSLLDFPTPVRSMKTFKSSGTIVYVTKNHMSRNYPLLSRYMLRAMKVNDN